MKMLIFLLTVVCLCVVSEANEKVGTCGNTQESSPVDYSHVIYVIDEPNSDRIIYEHNQRQYHQLGELVKSLDKKKEFTVHFLFKLLEETKEKIISDIKNHHILVKKVILTTSALPIDETESRKNWNNPAWVKEVNEKITNEPSSSAPVNAIIWMEQQASVVQQQVEEMERKGNSPEVQRVQRWEMEWKARQSLNNLINCISEPRYLYTMAIILSEGYQDSFAETSYDRVMWHGLECVVNRLAQLGTEEAYNYFIRLKNVYGTDGGKSLIYRSLEFKYLKKYSKDPKVLTAKSVLDFV